MTFQPVVQCLNSTVPLHPPLRLTQKFILNFSPPSNHASAGSYETHVFVAYTSRIQPVPTNLHNLTHQYNNTKSRVQIITFLYNFPNSQLLSPPFGQTEYITWHFFLNSYSESMNTSSHTIQHQASQCAKQRQSNCWYLTFRKQFRSYFWMNLSCLSNLLLTQPNKSIKHAAHAVTYPNCQENSLLTQTVCNTCCSPNIWSSLLNLSSRCRTFTSSSDSGKCWRQK